MNFTSSRQKHERDVYPKSKKRRFTTVTSHVNSSKSKNQNTYNSVDVIGNSNPTCINVHTKHSSNKLVTLQKETDTESSTSTSERNMDEKTQVKKQHIFGIQQQYLIIHVTTMDSIYSINKKKRISPLFNLSMELMEYLLMMMKLLSINIMHHFYLQIMINIYLPYHNMIQQNEE